MSDLRILLFCLVSNAREMNEGSTDYRAVSRAAITQLQKKVNTANIHQVAIIFFSLLIQLKERFQCEPSS